MADKWINISLLRNGISATLKEPTKAESRVEKVTRNPITAVLLGFILTTLVGSFLVNYLETKRAETDPSAAEERAKTERATSEQRARYEASLSAIHNFTRLAYERRERAAMLYYALERSAQRHPSDRGGGERRQEIVERKRLYDEAYLSWGANVQSNLFFIRTALNERNYSDFEELVETRLVPVLRRLDACVTDAYDNFLSQVDVRPAAQCNIPQELQLALDCNYAVTNELFQLTVELNGRGENQLADPSRPADRSAAIADINARCTMTNVPSIRTRESER